MLEYADWFGLILLAPFLVLELFWRARRYEAGRGWRLRALAVTAATFGVSFAVGRAWGALLPGWSLVDGAALGTWGGALAGILLYELMHYWYHRLAHEWDWLWRAGHQMHHSAESLDAFGAYYQHPVDVALFTTWAVIAFFPVLGLAPGSAAIAVAFLSFNAAFQHANIRTPRWLGYLIQRPESHAIHHGRGIHRWNYADLPVFDLLFGTFRNPAGDVPAHAGFRPGASARIGSMLAFRDVAGAA
jgi:sterol desaturase/sphingolipid hydroxylase (fatty acid hydroxylase superfamily)